MRNAEKTRFLLVVYANETQVEHFTDEIDLLEAFAEYRSSGVTCEAYEVKLLDLELTARRKVKGS